MGEKTLKLFNSASVMIIEQNHGNRSQYLKLGKKDLENTGYIDLHTHTTASDGTLRPKELIQLAKRCGLMAVAITDHDTISGLEEGLEEGENIGVEVMTGIEISAEPEKGTLHILGYGIDHKNQKLNRILGELIQARNNRNERIITKLGEHGVNISLEEVEAVAGGDVIGRPHFAKVMLNKGYAKNTREVFDVYLGRGGKCYLDKDRLTLQKSVELIKESGGIPVLAHPATLGIRDEAELSKALKKMRDIGIEGIEVYYSEHSTKQTSFLAAAAKDMGMLITGGTDFHGENKPNTALGTGKKGLRIPYKCLQDLKNRLAKQHNG